MKLRMIIVLFLTFLITAGCLSTVSSRAKTLRWDLTYRSIVDKNDKYDKWLWNWFGYYTSGNKDPNSFTSPILADLKTWDKGVIVSSFLIESPAFHAAEHYTIWAVETRNEAFYFTYVEDELSTETICSNKTKYHHLLEELKVWPDKQPSIEKRIDLGFGVYPGYVAIVSTYNNSGSNQFKIVFDDFLGAGDFTKNILLPIFKEMKEICITNHLQRNS